jgi:hypothetical protein
MVLSFLVATCGFAKGVVAGVVGALVVRGAVMPKTEKR